ncbi:MAG: diguanylate cyclase [Pseudomonadota bacterium]
MLESDDTTDWQVAGSTTSPDEDDRASIVSPHEIINSMEQGILVWSPDGVCEMHNDRVFELLEMRRDDLFEGLTRVEFHELAVKRSGLISDLPGPEIVRQLEATFDKGKRFALDWPMPSGRIVAATARPMADKRFVVTFSDVTEARKAQQLLTDAKAEAEEASEQASKALALEKARRLQTRLLSEFDEWLHCCKSLDELLRVLGIFMERLLPGSSGQLYVYSNSRDVLDGKCSWKSKGALEFIRPDDCWSLRRGRPYSYGTGDVDLTCTHVDDDGGADRIGEYLCIPILAHGDTVGLMHVRYALGSNMLKGRDNPNSKVSTTHQFAIQCAEHISLAIANVRLRDQLQDQSTKDSLTGLFNRRYFLDSMRSAIGHAERKSERMSVLTLDADHFKRFNDNHGHDAGDLVLRMISKSMMSACSSGQVPCRLGGEEFAILLPDSEIAKGLAFAEELRKTIEAQTIRYSGEDLPKVTVSIGVSEFPTHGTEPQGLLKTADVALYTAKAEGRNRTCTPPSEIAAVEDLSAA